MWNLDDETEATATANGGIARSTQVSNFIAKFFGLLMAHYFPISSGL